MKQNKTKNLDTEITGSELGHRWCENKGKYEKLKTKKNNTKNNTKFEKNKIQIKINITIKIIGNKSGYRIKGFRARTPLV